MLHTKNTTTSYVIPIMHSNGKDSVPEKMSSPSTTPLPTMPTVPSTTAGIEQHTPLTRMHSIHNTSTANSSGSKVRTKPVKRNSYFGSFIQTISASNKHTTCTAADMNKVNTVQQDYNTLNNGVQKSSNNNNKILPVAE